MQRNFPHFLFSELAKAKNNSNLVTTRKSELIEVS